MEIFGTLIAFLLLVGWPVWILIRLLHEKSKIVGRKVKIVGSVFFVLNMILLFYASPGSKSDDQTIIEVAWHVLAMWPWLDIAMKRVLME